MAGCSYEGRGLGSYLNEPSTIIEDPHYSSYKEKKDAMESKYLRKEITYSEYLDETQKLDDMYAQEVDERTKIIDSTQAGE